VTTDDTPSEVPVNATAKLGSGAIVGDATYIPTWVADNADWGSYMISTPATSDLRGDRRLGVPGFATTDTVVKVADQNGTPVTPSAELKNVWDDTYDVGYYSTWDVTDMVRLSDLQPQRHGPGQRDRGRLQRRAFGHPPLDRDARLQHPRRASGPAPTSCAPSCATMVR